MRVGRDDHVRIPRQHLLDRDLHQPALAQRRGDVGRADPLDRLHVDRPGEAGVESARPAPVVDARAALARNLATRRSDVVEHVLRVAGRAPRRAPARPACRRDAVAIPESGRTRRRAAGRACRSAPARGRPARRRSVDRAVVDDQVRLRGEHDLDVRGVAATGQASERRKIGVLGRNERPLVRPERRRPAEQLLGREREHEHRRRRTGREDALDLRRDLGPAAGVVGDGARRLPARERRNEREGDAASEKIASRPHAGAPTCRR